MFLLKMWCLILSTVLFTTSSYAASTQAVASSVPQLKLLWQVSGFDKPESVLYEKTSNAIYLTSINGNGTVKNGLGYISKLSVSGELTQLKWLDGLNAPKGMAQLGDTLYVADIDELLEISISKAKVVKRHKIAGAKFLNDVEVDAFGNVYVSDTATSRIHRLSKGKLSIWVNEQQLGYPNGLYAEKNHMVVAASGLGKGRGERHLQKVDYQTQEVSDVSTTGVLGVLDGVQHDGSANYFYSSWKTGELFYYHGNSATLLKKHGKGAADFKLVTISGKKLLLLPVMMPGKLLAYEVE